MAKTKRKSGVGGYRPGSGRKPIGPVKLIRASERQWSAYRRMADREGLSLSAWIRQALDKTSTTAD